MENGERDRLPFDVDPWSIGLAGLDESQLAHRESVFALSNGHVGWRGTLDEGEPHSAPGSYLNGVFESHPMPYAEDGYGYPDRGESVINVANGQIMRLFVDDEPLDVRRGRVLMHEQRLDFRDGTLRRELEWMSPAGRTIRLTSTRLVSLTHRSVAAVHFEVEAVGDAVDVSVQSELVANEPLTHVHPDPQVKEVLEQPLACVLHGVLGTAASLVHRTRESDIDIAVSMDHHVESATAEKPAVETQTSTDLARTTISARLQPGERLEITKFVGHEFSQSLSAPALRDRADAAVADAARAGWHGLLAGQRERLDAFWAQADVQVDGVPRLQQATRFALFHVFQSAARAELRSIPGKGLTGAGYQGHTFWDSEGFVLPVLTYTIPSATEQALRWRHSTLDHARDRAEQLHLEGAAFAWRTVSGRESSGYWPASTIAFHVNADIAAAVVHYVRTTGDEVFERECGVEMLVETARLWASYGRWDDAGVFHLEGVTGPDEYSAMVDDNTYTNVMARLNLEAAVDAAGRHPELARSFGVTDDELAAWAAAASAVAMPFDEKLGVHEQSAGFTRRQEWDFDSVSVDQYPLQEHFPYFDIYRKQVIKQADLVLALYFATDRFTLDEKRRAFDYSEPRTVRDSSLSAAAQAVIAAEVGHLDLAADYLAEAATLDLDDLHDNTAEGLHMASLAGIWTALTAGFGGMRDTDQGLRFAPRLPPHVARLRFGVRLGSRTLRVDVTPDATGYSIDAGTLELQHFDEPLTVTPSGVSSATPPLADAGQRPDQPRHRRPRSFAEAFDIPPAG